MKLKIGFLSFTIITLGLLINLTNSQNAQQRALQIALDQISSGSEQFAMNLYQNLTNESDNSGIDFIISPFSVWSLLILTAEGAGGRTYSQLQDALGLPADLTYIREGYKNIQKAFKVNTSTVEIAVEQVLFSDANSPVEIEYQHKIQNVYEADFKLVDFKKVKDTTFEINDYVRGATRGRISKIVNRSDIKNAHMLLLSAIYFKGQWKFPFNISETVKEPFYNEQGVNTGNVNMMKNLGAFPYAGIPALAAYALELPYGNENRLSMVFLLPRKNTNLSTVIEKLSTYSLRKLLAELRNAEEEFPDDEVEISIPRFRIAADFSLNIILEKMGILDLFHATEANLSKMSRDNLYLSRVIHKAEIEVNEEGTIASAVSGGSFVNKSSPPKFYANRPFAYLIIEKSTNILVFCGIVKNAPNLQF